MNDKARAPAPQPVDLALQGGGSHGAFTWGVLDRLLEDGSLRFAGISGTSAGALNAAVMVTGLARGGNEAARDALRAFWHDVAQSGGIFGAWQQPQEVPGGPWSPVSLWQTWVRSFSPYDVNPFGLDPLRDAVRRHVDEALLRAADPALFITATSVRTGQPHVFSGAELSVDALLASACLPHLFRAVEIGGHAYWDGGYSGNPAIWPLVYGTPVNDVLLVKIAPLERSSTPQTALAIADRVTEIGFNTALAGEMRAIAFVQRLIAQQRVDPGSYKNLRMHMITDEAGLGALEPPTKLNTSLAFLESLFAMGRAAAGHWLGAHRAAVGQRSSLDIEATFLARR